MKKFWISFCFYAADHFKKKSLIILGLFFLAPIAAFFAIDHFGTGSNTQTAIVQSSETFRIDEGIFEGIEGIDFHFVTEDAARLLFAEGEIDDMFIISGTSRPVLYVETSHLNPSPLVKQTLMQALTNLHLEGTMVENDLPLDLVAQLVTPIEVHLEVAQMEDLIAVEIINVLAPLSVLMVVAMTGTTVANSVAAEKSSRVMEVMLGKVHPTYTMVSKVLSSLVGFLMPVVGLIGGVAAAQLIGLTDLGEVLALVDSFFSLDALLLSFVVIILGYFCFIFFFAAAGAIANSVESLTSTINPLFYSMMLPYFMVTFMDIEGPLMDILVYIPIFSPYALIQRYMLGLSNVVEVVIVLTIMILFSLLTLFISARLYMNGISHTSEKVSFKDLRKMLVK